MKNTIKTLLLAAALTIASGCVAYSSDNSFFARGKKVVPSGKDTTVVFSGIPASYSRIDVSGAFFSVYYSNTAKELKVVADENIVPYLKIRLSGDELEIGLESVTLNELKRIEVYVPVSSRNLSSIDLSGACSFISDDTIKGKDLKLDLSGASKVELDVDVKYLSVDVSGAGAISLSGNAHTADIDCSGACKIRSRGDRYLKVDKAGIDISGAASIKGIQGGQIRGDLSGAAKLVVLRGSDVSGVSCSGASKINVID